MSGRFAWVPDLERGEWLRPMEAEPPDSILSVVPRGFEAYARVFHPVDRDRPRRTRTWQGLDETTYFEGVDDIEASLETERTTWAQAAESFGTTMHAQAQYARLLRGDHGDVDGAIAADGWRYGATREGCLDAVSLATASAVLARHTATPDAGIAAIWEGWGGLVSSAGNCALRARTERRTTGPMHRRGHWAHRRSLPSRAARCGRAAGDRRSAFGGEGFFGACPQQSGTGLWAALS